MSGLAQGFRLVSSQKWGHPGLAGTWTTAGSCRWSRSWGCPTGLGRPATDYGAFPDFWELAAGGSYPGPYLPRGKAGLGFRNLLFWFGSSLPGSQ